MSGGNSRGRLSVALAAIAALAYPGWSNTAAQDEVKFRNDVLTQSVIGSLESGRYAFKATRTTIAPRAQIPFHVHEHHGLRYVLDGEITIQWKDGRAQTFAAGSTYIEGPGENHPAGVMSAMNPTDRETQILIVELVRME